MSRIGFWFLLHHRPFHRIQLATNLSEWICTECRNPVCGNGAEINTKRCIQLLIDDWYTISFIVFGSSTTTGDDLGLEFFLDKMCWRRHQCCCFLCEKFFCQFNGISAFGMYSNESETGLVEMYCTHSRRTAKLIFFQFSIWDFSSI